jgi:hypothetical protein
MALPGHLQYCTSQPELPIFQGEQVNSFYHDIPPQYSRVNLIFTQHRGHCGNMFGTNQGNLPFASRTATVVVIFQTVGYIGKNRFQGLRSLHTLRSYADMYHFSLLGQPVHQVFDSYAIRSHQ